MPIAKVQNAAHQFIAVRNAAGIVQGANIAIATQSSKLTDLLALDPNTEYVLIDFFGSVWLRFDGQPASAQNGHKFTSDNHPVFSREMIENITVVSADENATSAFVSQLGSAC